MLADWAASSVDELARGNCLSDANQLQVGQVIRVPIVPSVTPVGYVPPTPLPTSDGAPPQVLSFTSSAAEANTGDSITVTWETEGAAQIFLRREYWDSTVSTATAPQDWENLSAAGSQTVTMSNYAEERFKLIIYNGSQRIEAPLTIKNLGVLINAPIDIVSFTGQVSNDKIVLNWHVTGTDAATVSLRTIFADGTFGQWFNDLPLAGSLTIDIPAEAQGSISFMLMPITETGDENLPFDVIQTGKHQITVALP